MRFVHEIVHPYCTFTYVRRSKPRPEIRKSAGWQLSIAHPIRAGTRSTRSVACDVKYGIVDCTLGKVVLKGNTATGKCGVSSKLGDLAAVYRYRYIAGAALVYVDQHLV